MRPPLKKPARFIGLRSRARGQPLAEPRHDIGGPVGDRNAGLGKGVDLFRGSAGGSRNDGARGPIRRPGGAVRPAMKPITGLVMCSATKRAASCSSVPPISPIMTTAVVAGSASNAARQSMKLVPLIGSPPIPTQVVCPKPARVSWSTTS